MLNALITSETTTFSTPSVNKEEATFCAASLGLSATTGITHSLVSERGVPMFNILYSFLDTSSFASINAVAYTVYLSFCIILISFCFDLMSFARFRCEIVLKEHILGVSNVDIYPLFVHIPHVPTRLLVFVFQGIA